uniref:Uncharacterized protein n=1 Tax=Candidatus Kentrum sp. SD TaxID=2126332 RepID=A0A451BN30_9GAMM|nr:MAG: Protein of unknown function (DUF3680) [Candidatus Kentron sp. SD]
MNHSKIPITDSISELAAFWDTHDLTDFEEELEEVTEQVFTRETITEPEAVIEVLLSPVEAETVR